jgi:hypothetical protein
MGVAVPQRAAIIIAATGNIPALDTPPRTRKYPVLPCGGSAAVDVGEWLKGVGLGQHEATFRAHDIDVDVLPDVTEADLEKIGLPLGARKRLTKAIARVF